MHVKQHHAARYSGGYIHEEEEEATHTSAAARYPVTLGCRSQVEGVELRKCQRVFRPFNN